MTVPQWFDLQRMFSIQGRVAVVTGGAGLLGVEFCRTLASAGAQVVVADLVGDAAGALADELNRGGLPQGSPLQRALAVQTDVTQPASVQALVQTTLATYGRLDILVNSAALDPKVGPDDAPGSQTSAGDRVRPELGNFETYPLAAWNQALAVNLTGAMLCCQAAVIPMLAQGRGVIINLSSIYGLVAPDQRIYQRPGQPTQYKPVYYTVTKAGLLGLTQYLATYYAGQNIRVNALTPGGVHNQQDPAFVQAYSARAVLGRMAHKSDMNGALLFLASDASEYMTGANLVVDGGWTAW